MAFCGISYRSFSGGRPTKGWTGIIRLAYPWRMRPLPPLSAIRVFEAAARLENFTAAAQELGMTQAAVSYQMNMLEERLGLSLFQRAGRHIALTRSEEHTSELQSLIRNSSAAFGLKTNNNVYHISRLQHGKHKTKE